MLALSGTGWFGLSIVRLIIWVAIAFWPARVARRKGAAIADGRLPSTPDI